MKELKTILVAVAVDETSRKALVPATRLARQFGSEIVLMHAIEPVYGADYEEHVSGGLPQILMGQTALKLARQLPCSLLSVKHADALIAKLEQDITEIHGANREGHTLLNRGFYEEALGRFEQCLRIDPFFAPALEGKAEVHERLGHAEEAKQYRKLAETIRQSLWGLEATADVGDLHDEVLA